MAYVDLNPIRARMADTTESSDHTSIQRRISAARDGRQPDVLLSFAGDPRETMPEGMPFRTQDYIELVDWSGRILRKGKHGAIDSSLPPILERLQIDPGTGCISTVTSRAALSHSSSAFTPCGVRESSLASAGPMAFATASAAYPRRLLPKTLLCY